jgi:hypothetical protein
MRILACYTQLIKAVLIAISGSFYILSFIGCINPNQQNKSVKELSPSTSYTDYNKIPAYIKNYLDSLDNGKFLIANPGEPWNAGCSRRQGEPSKQLIVANLNTDTFKIKYWAGGIANMQNRIVLVLKNQKVKGHQYQYQIEAPIVNSK